MTDLPSLNALRAFDSVARLRSVTAAAAELSVTPSAVSRQISNLEEEIGIALLKREGRGVCRGCGMRPSLTVSAAPPLL